MYEKPRVNVKVEPRSTFTFTSDLPYIVSNLFTHVKPVKVYVRTHVKITRQWKSTLTKTGNRIWKVCSTQGMTKSADHEMRHNFSWVDWDAGWVIRSQFSLRLNCYEILWLYIDKSRLQSFRRTFTVIIRRTLYHGNSVCPYKIWLVMTASV